MINWKIVHIDPLILFTRLEAIIQRGGGVTDHFIYELTPEPTSLIKSGYEKTCKSHQ